MGVSKDTATVAWSFTIISAILISLAFTWRLCRLRSMPLLWKLSLSFLDISYFTLDAGIAVALISKSDGSTPGCKAAAFLTLFSYQDCIWTLLLADVIFLFVQSPLDLTISKPPSYHKSLFFIFALPQKFVETLLALLPQTPLEYFDMATPYLVKCFPFRRPIGKGSAYFVMLIALSWMAITVACITAITNIFRIWKKQSVRVHDSSVTDGKSVSIFLHGRRIILLSVIQHAMSSVTVLLTTLTYYSGVLGADDTQTTLLLVFSTGSLVHGLVSLAGDFFGDTSHCICGVKSKAEPEMNRHLKKLEYLGSSAILVKMKVIWEDGTTKNIEQGLLKVFQPENLKFWAQEIVILGMLRKLQHPCLLQCIWTENMNQYHEAMTLITGETISPSSRIICLELLNLGNLRGLFKTLRAPLSEMSLCSLLHDIASGLSHLHALSVLHANLNTKNIYIRGTLETQSLRAAIGDFEYAQIASARPHQPLFERTHRLPLEPRDPRHPSTDCLERFVSDMRSLALVILEMMSINCMLVYSDQHGQVSLENAPLSTTMADFEAQSNMTEALRHSTPDFLMRSTENAVRLIESDGSATTESVLSEQVHNLPDVVRIQVTPKTQGDIPVIYPRIQELQTDHQSLSIASGRSGNDSTRLNTNAVEYGTNGMKLTEKQMTVDETNSFSSDCSVIGTGNIYKRNIPVRSSSSLRIKQEDEVVTKIGQETDDHPFIAGFLSDQPEADIDDGEISEEVQRTSRYGNMKPHAGLNPRKAERRSYQNDKVSSYFGPTNHQTSDPHPWIILDSGQNVSSLNQSTSLQQSSGSTADNNYLPRVVPVKNSPVNNTMVMSSMEEVHTSKTVSDGSVDDDNDANSKRNKDAVSSDMKSDCPMSGNVASGFLRVLLNAQSDEILHTEKSDLVTAEKEDSDERGNAFDASQCSEISGSSNSSTNPTEINDQNKSNHSLDVTALHSSAQPIDSTNLEDCSVTNGGKLCLSKSRQVPSDISAKEKKFHLTKRTKARKHMRKAMGVRSVATTLRHNRSVLREGLIDYKNISSTNEVTSNNAIFAPGRQMAVTLDIDTKKDYIGLSCNESSPVNEDGHTIPCLNGNTIYVKPEMFCKVTDDAKFSGSMNGTSETLNIRNLNSAELIRVQPLSITPSSDSSDYQSISGVISLEPDFQNSDKTIEQDASDNNGETLAGSFGTDISGFTYIPQISSESETGLRDLVSQNNDTMVLELLDSINEEPSRTNATPVPAVCDVDHFTTEMSPSSDKRPKHPKGNISNSRNSFEAIATECHNVSSSCSTEDDEIPDTETSCSDGLKFSPTYPPSRFLSDKPPRMGILTQRPNDFPDKTPVRAIVSPIDNHQSSLVSTLHESLLMKNVRRPCAFDEMMSDACSSSSESHVRENKTWFSSTLYDSRTDRIPAEERLVSTDGKQIGKLQKVKTRRSQIKMGTGVKVNTLFHGSVVTRCSSPTGIGRSLSTQQSEDFQYLPSNAEIDCQNRLSKVQGNLTSGNLCSLEHENHLTAIIRQKFYDDRRPSIDSRQELFLNQPKTETSSPSISFQPKTAEQTVVVDSDLVIDRIVSAKQPGRNLQPRIPRNSMDPTIAFRSGPGAKVFGSNSSSLAHSEQMLPTGVTSRHIRQCQKLSSSLQLFSYNDFIPATNTNLRILQERLRLVGSLGPIGTELLEIMGLCWMSDTPPTAASVAKRLQTICAKDDSVTEV